MLCPQIDYLKDMEEVHSSTTNNPQRKMFFPHSVDHQLITNMANSAKETIEAIKPYATRTNGIDEQFAKRVHELMRFRTHTVDTDGF